MEIILIRHGETKGNRERRYVGTTDEPLTPEGEDRLKENADRYPQPDKVVISPMKRCRQSAMALYPEMPVFENRSLRECDFGRFEYKNAGELAEDPGWQPWIDSGGTLPFPQGESREAFAKRCRSAFAQEVQKAAEEGVDRLAFVVHGGTLMAVLDAFSCPHRDYFSWQVLPGCGYRCLCVLTDSGEIALKDPAALPLPALTGVEEMYISRQGGRLRCGYTTGTCAAAASAAAARMLLFQRPCERIAVRTPKGPVLHLQVEERRIEERGTLAGIRKDAGDDPDVTDRALIRASASFDRPSEGSEHPFVFDTGEGTVIVLDAGEGVGRVTAPGLEQPVGAPAINRVPRQMILEAVQETCMQAGYTGRLYVTISVPGGETLAERTFNGRLGIRGGISILGTSGIVVPMSEQAIVDSIRLEIRQKIARGRRRLLVTPGNYGADYVRNQDLFAFLSEEDSVKCSNYVGQTLDIAMEEGAESVLFVAHIGKFVKVSGGIMNTHSAEADCRAELMAAHAVRAGADAPTALRLLETRTTEEAVSILRERGLLEETMKVLLERLSYYLQRRCREQIDVEAVVFSRQAGLLGSTPGAAALIGAMKEETI